MKKMKMHMLIGVVCAFALLCGCQKNETEADKPLRGRISVSALNALSNAANDPDTRAEGAELVYTLEVWTSGDAARCVLHQTTTGNLDGALFDVALIPGTYDFLYWADYGQGYYETENLRQVNRSSASYTSGTSRDAFAAASQAVEWNGGTISGVVLKRPLAKLTILSSVAFQQSQSVSVTYSAIPTRYDVLTEEVSEVQQVQVTLPGTTTGSDQVGEDFLFVPSDERAGISITVGSVTRELEDLPLKKNFQTRLTASFTTD